MRRHKFQVGTNGKGLVDITDEINAYLAKQDMKEAMVNVYLHHTSASLQINEGADGRVADDLENWFERAVVDGDALFTHREEGDDDMSAHVRVALTVVSLLIPVADGKLDLGRWQRVFLWEHRHGPMTRDITLTVWG